MLAMVLKELPTTVRNALSIRVNAEKDTMVATRIVSDGRNPPIPSVTLLDRYLAR
jgi:hypothetical protein